MVLSPTEETPLVERPEDKDLEEEIQRNKVGGLHKYLFGFILIVAGLIGAYFLGRATSSDGNNNGDVVAPSFHQRSSSTTPPPRRKRHGDQNEDDDFVRLDDYDETMDTNGDDGSGDDDRVKYIGTQFISFTINTMGGLNEEGECEGHVVSADGTCYLGNPTNITEDVHHRLAIVKHVVGKLKEDSFNQNHDIDHADDVLKIVMFPEFFWRGPDGAYSTRQLLQANGVLVQVATVIRKLISDDFFNDFLFVFGTVIVARSPGDPRQPWEHALSAEEVEYFNFASVAKGGSGGKHFAVTKKYISGADFLSRTSLPNPKDFNVHDYTAMGKDLEDAFAARDITLIHDNVVELDGLRIGVEICLDHRLGVLWNTLKTKHHGELVDILLITSAGMSIEHGVNPIVPGGVVYLSDGGASSAACARTDHSEVFDPSQVCRGDIGGLKHIPIGGPGYSSFFGLTACWDVEDMTLLKGYYSMFRPQGCAFTLATYDIDVMDDFKYYPPSIEIYPTVALPIDTYTRNR